MTVRQLYDADTQAAAHKARLRAAQRERMRYQASLAALHKMLDEVADIAGGVLNTDASHGDALTALRRIEKIAKRG